jgi:CAI-1 autoinducer synthase
MCSPVTPRNKSLVRLSLHAGLEPIHIERILDVCRGIRDDVQPDRWPSLTGARRAAGLNTVVRLSGSTSA